MTKDEQIAYLWDVIEKIHTLAHDGNVEPELDYIASIAKEALRKVPLPEPPMRKCQDCDGTGEDRDGYYAYCQTCDGLGSIEVPHKQETDA